LDEDSIESSGEITVESNFQTVPERRAVLELRVPSSAKVVFIYIRIVSGILC